MSADNHGADLSQVTVVVVTFNSAHCIADLADALKALRKSGQQPEKWPVNARMSLLTAASAYATWQSG